MQTSVAPSVLAAPRQSSSRAHFSRARAPACLARRSCVTLAAAAAPAKPVIKVCGVTTIDEARQAAKAGATMVGLILWPKSKRSVDLAKAKEMAAAVIEAGATPVAVFVDEDTETIVAALDATGMTWAQLHGDGARSALGKLPDKYKAIWVVNADAEGKILTPLPADLVEPKENPLGGVNGWKRAVNWVSNGRRVVDWLLVDGVQPGSGETYDWSKLKVPKGASRKGWILAGGLDPDNVAKAMKVALPNGVDVSTGVTLADGVKKDPTRVEAFIKAANGAAAMASAP